MVEHYTTPLAQSAPSPRLGVHEHPVRPAHGYSVEILANGRTLICGVILPPFRLLFYRTRFDYASEPSDLLL
jgi:hypothetical protein